MSATRLVEVPGLRHHHLLPETKLGKCNAKAVEISLKIRDYTSHVKVEIALCFSNLDGKSHNFLFAMKTRHAVHHNKL